MTLMLTNYIISMQGIHCGTLVLFDLCQGRRHNLLIYLTLVKKKKNNNNNMIQENQGTLHHQQTYNYF